MGELLNDGKRVRRQTEWKAFREEAKKKHTQERSEWKGQAQKKYYCLNIFSLSGE